MLLVCSWPAACAEIELIEFRGEEFICLPFRYELLLLVNQQLDIDKLLRTLIKCQIHYYQSIRYFSGYVDSIECIEQSLNGCYKFQLVVVPWFHLLNDHSQKRNFKSMSVLDISKEVLLKYYIRYIDYSVLTKSYPLISYVVQYDETDFQFLSRIFSEAGIYYYFLQSQGRHQLVLFDNNVVLPSFNHEVLRSDEVAPSQQVIFEWHASYSLKTFDECYQRYYGSSHYQDFYPALRINMDDSDKVMTEVIHYAYAKNHIEHYHNEFICIPLLESIVTEAIHKPVINGVQNATVIEGCTRIRYDWGDSVKLPVLQNWAGNQWGTIIMPQCNDKVIVAYINGEAAHPVILGSSSLERQQQGFIAQESDQMVWGEDQLALKVSGNLEKNIQHNYNELIDQDDEVALEMGDYVINIPQGVLQLSAAHSIRFQVGDSYLELTPESITLHAAAIEFNPLEDL